MPTETSSPSGGGQQTAWGSRFSFVLRYLGFVPRNLSAAPRSAACFVADQLEEAVKDLKPQLTQTETLAEDLKQQAKRLAADYKARSRKC